MSPKKVPSFSAVSHLQMYPSLFNMLIFSLSFQIRPLLLSSVLSHPPTSLQHLLTGTPPEFPHTLSHSTLRAPFAYDELLLAELGPCAALTTTRGLSASSASP